MGRPFITLQDDQEKLRMKYNALKRRHTMLQRSYRIEVDQNRLLEDTNRTLEQIRSSLEHDKKKLELDLDDAESDVRHAQRVAVRSFRTCRHLQHVLGLVEQQLDVGYIRSAIAQAYYRGINGILQTGLRIHAPDEGDLYMGPPEPMDAVPATPPLIVEIEQDAAQPPPPGIDQANEVIELLREAIEESEQQQQQQPRATSWHGSPINADLIELSSGEEEEGEDINDGYVMSPVASDAEGQSGPSGN